MIPPLDRLVSRATSLIEREGGSGTAPAPGFTPEADIDPTDSN
jgi:hypothetical protein